MKTILCFTLTLLIFVMLMSVRNSFAQDASSEYVVRVIYFIPNDREPDLNIDAYLDKVIKDVQRFYADEMERYGFGRKTFRLENDETDKLIVHRVEGKFTNMHYHDAPSEIAAVETEIDEKFDTSKNIIYLSWIDLYNPEAAKNQIWGIGSGTPIMGKVRLVSTNFDFANFERIPQHDYIRAWTVVAHELGHAFGLSHDFRNDAYIMSYGGLQVSELSPCAAKWLDAHRYFNANESALNHNTIVKMLTPNLDSTLASIHLQFEITDPDGLHQAILITKAAQGLIGCKQLSGYSDTIEFDTTNITTDSTAISLAVMDSHGNFKVWKFNVNITSLLVPKIVSIPDANLAETVRKTLGLTPTTPITQLDMLKLTTLKNSEKRRIPEHQITDLTGIQYALNLRYLYLRHNQIRDISPLKTLTQLKGLSLEGNQITDLTSIAKLTNLTSLLLSGNPLLDLTHLTTLTQLKELSLAGNNINDITPLASLTNLSRLWLSNNQISDVNPLVKLVNLQELYLVDNPIKNREPLLTLLEKNPNVEIYLKNDREPLPVTLSHFRADHTNTGVVLKWATESEIDNAGFYIYRSETKNGEFKAVNPTMIQGAGTTGERNEYTWTDTTAKPNTIYYYRIEDVSHAGVREQLAIVRLRGLVSASSKLTTRWADLKVP